MTNNGRRVKCYCLADRCRGKDVDWRTSEKHKKKDGDLRKKIRLLALDYRPRNAATHPVKTAKASA
jgi:hypothetical protein